MALSRVKLTPIHRGDPRTIVVSIKDPDGDPIDLSGSTWVSTVRALQNSTIGTPLTVDTTQAELGVLSLHLSAPDSAGLANTLEGDLQGSDFGTVLEFYTIVRGDSTRAPAPEGGLVDSITLTWGGSTATLSDAVLAILVPTAAGLEAFDFIQASPVDTQTINHNLGHRPNVDVFTVGGIKLACQVQHLNENQVQVSFNTPQGFTARMI